MSENAHSNTIEERLKSLEGRYRRLRGYFVATLLLTSVLIALGQAPSVQQELRVRRIHVVDASNRPRVTIDVDQPAQDARYGRITLLGDDNGTRLELRTGIVPSISLAWQAQATHIGPSYVQMKDTAEATSAVMSLPCGVDIAGPRGSLRMTAGPSRGHSENGWQVACRFYDLDHGRNSPLPVWPSAPTIQVFEGARLRAAFGAASILSGEATRENRSAASILLFRDDGSVFWSTPR